MRSPTTGLRVAGAVFGAMAVAQAARLLLRPQVVVNGWEMPLWPSALAVIALGGLCLWMWKLAGRADEP